jgi:hypothetical protein
MQPKMGGKFHLRLNIGKRPIANKYREGKMKRTLKRELNSTWNCQKGNAWNQCSLVGTQLLGCCLHGVVRPDIRLRVVYSGNQKVHFLTSGSTSVLDAVQRLREGSKGTCALCVIDRCPYACVRDWGTQCRPPLGQGWLFAVQVVCVRQLVDVYAVSWQSFSYTSSVLGMLSK